MIQIARFAVNDAGHSSNQLQLVIHLVSAAYMSTKKYDKLQQGTSIGCLFSCYGTLVI